MPKKKRSENVVIIIKIKIFYKHLYSDMCDYKVSQELIYNIILSTLKKN